RFDAYRWDAETGFYQVRYRYLHPTLGRWVSRDPIEEQVFRLTNNVQMQTDNASQLYSYVDNNSIDYTDKMGLAPNPCGTDECKCLGCMTYAEARGKPGDACQKAVADAIKNRAFTKDKSGRWVKTRSFCDVVSERNGKEFNGYTGPNYKPCCEDKCVNKPGKGSQDKTERDQAFKNAECDPTNSGGSTAAGSYAGEANYFNNVGSTPDWITTAIREGRAYEVKVTGCSAMVFYHVDPKKNK
ncbi:MAG: hypothetical protein EBS84_22595, partial [Proteobacteria bacterium]|nr:hypothetical protein [Verrucomicrobiota bacterium]NBU11751.1 hypothetical protein [Pseudomonadota bacterium]